MSETAKRLVDAEGRPLTPLGDDQYRHRIYVPTPIETLPPPEPVDWIWPGYVARGKSTLLTGLWKAGKTTLLSHVLRELRCGGELVPDPIADLRALVISEESESAWSVRRDELDLTGIDLMARPLMGATQLDDWQSLIADAAQHCREAAIGLVVIDTISGQWPVVDENAAPLVRLALDPLTEILSTGAGLLLMAHPRKSGGTHGNEVRGSGALPAWVDAICTFSRFSEDDDEDTRRTMRAVGRMDDIPAEMVFQLERCVGLPPRYRRVGKTSVATRVEAAATLAWAMEMLGARDVLSAVPEAAILDAWASRAETSRSNVRRAIAAAVTARAVVKLGRGTKTDPARYYVANPLAYGGMVAPEPEPDQTDLF